MKLSSSFLLFLFLSLLFFSLAMAEEDQRKELSKEQSLPSIDQPVMVSDGEDAGRDRPSFTMKPPSRKEWPVVVGMSVEEAEKRIREDMAMVIFQVVLPDYFVTMDYNPRRVRLYVDSSGKVVRPAKIG